jgi:hypothetical protein
MRGKIMWFCLTCFLSVGSSQAQIRTTEAGLLPGQQLELEEFSVEFLGVTSDSRCPEQVTCIWPGEAKILLGISENGQYYEREVVIMGKRLVLTLIGDLEIQVLQLSPYPETATGIAPEAYCLSMALTLPEPI